MKNIISASRRTDIPAFYSDWFVRRLREGYVYARNPYGGKTRRVTLSPGHIHSIVFWSKNFNPLIGRLPEVEESSRNLFFHFTITGAPAGLEPHTPEARDAVKDLVYLSERYTPEHVVWRFDPIVITKDLTFEWHEEAFSRLAEALAGSVLRCHTSFVNPYRKVLRNFSNHRTDLIDPPMGEKISFLQRLATIAKRYGIGIYSCCADDLVSGDVRKALCIDGARLTVLFNDPDVDATLAPTREGCACTRSVDIGAYDTCGHGCVYCYANSAQEKALEALRRHDPLANGLGFHMEGKEEEDPVQPLLFSESREAKP